MKSEEIKKWVVSVLQEIDPIAEINDSTNLLEDILDSMGIIYLTEEILNQYGVEIPNAEVKEKNFSNVNQIVELIEKYSAIKE